MLTKIISEVKKHREKSYTCHLRHLMTHFDDYRSSKNVINSFDTIGIKKFSKKLLKILFITKVIQKKKEKKRKKKFRNPISPFRI